MGSEACETPWTKLHRPTGALGSQAVGNLEQKEATPRELLPWDAAPRAGTLAFPSVQPAPLLRTSSPMTT